MEGSGREWGWLLKIPLFAATGRLTEELSSALVTMQWFEEIMRCVVIEAVQQILRNGFT